MSPYLQRESVPMGMIGFIAPIFRVYRVERQKGIVDFRVKRNRACREMKRESGKPTPLRRPTGARVALQQSPILPTDEGSLVESEDIAPGRRLPGGRGLVNEGEIGGGFDAGSASIAGHDRFG